jgi:hypothetical protein
MTDWSRLDHAFGSAEDVPDLLERLTSHPTSALWSELWSVLCHQGSVYSASYAALPWLAEQAGGDREQAVPAVVLAGAIMTGAGNEAAEVRAEHAAQLAILAAAVHRHRARAADRSEYLYLLQAMLGLAGEVDWAETWPGVSRTRSSRSSAPAVPRACSSSLAGVGRRLHDIALADGQQEVAHALTYVFGTATCPARGTAFSVAGQVVPE